MSAAVADSSTPSGDYVASFSQNDQVVQVASDSANPQNNRTQVAPVKPGSSPFDCLKRAWFSVRWKLSRCIFSRPVPFLTAKLDLKLGDVLITLPVSAVVLAINANLCAREQVKESGSLPMIAMIVVFALTVRNNSILLTLTGLPFERALLYHKFAGVVAILLSGLHGLAYLLEDAGIAAVQRRLGGGVGAGTPLIERQTSGAILFYLLAALWVFSLSPIRRRFYEAFLRLHWVLFIAIVVFSIIHGAGGVVIGLIPWALDLVFRHGYLVQKNFRGGLSKPGVISQQQVSMSHLPGDFLRIQFPRVHADTGSSFKYEAGQYVFICVPKLSLLEWHPFTISSSPHEVLVTIHIKALGDWTKKLLAAVRSLRTEPTSGGIGITPMQAIANQLFFDFHHRGRQALKKVHFVWSVRERNMVEAMMNSDFAENRKLLQGHTPAYLPDDLLSVGPNGGSTSPSDVFKTEFYLTRGHPDPETPIDRQLQHCLRYNTRPDVADVMKSLGQDARSTARSELLCLSVDPPHWYET
ncbi:hypothetical protein PF001_g16636 [Phytophthora fragariae]|uniref:FAD-binding FR-type domain-containing protein n=1 Tax=Phytophthora fragariae TaxID=53985 RepID=A0A6A4D338_9STRA|nr:hypothetical protein PF003_g17630 [Phytophthora fragariae]KAE9296921.1 hypothetical protein PF001_g16636 [Phytophthora fragariae]